MPEDLRIRVGNEVGTIPLNGTPQQIAAVLTRYATALGIPTDGTPTQNLTAILEHIRDDVRRTAKQAHRQQLRAEADAQLNETIESENNL